MKCRAYFYLAKLKIQQALTYRFDFITTFLLQCIIMFSVSYFWIAAYKDVDFVFDVNKKNMLTYTTISILMSNMLSIGIQYTILEDIRSGNISFSLLRPANTFLLYFSKDIGELFVSIFQKNIPLLLISCVFFGLPLPASSFHFIFFLFSFVCSFLINWLLAALMGLLAFKTLSIGPLMAVKGNLLKLLSGSIVPLWFFPNTFQKVLEFLPFVSIYQFPLGIYIGKYSISESIYKIIFQILWTVALYIVFLCCKKKIQNILLIQGG